MVLQIQRGGGAVLTLVGAIIAGLAGCAPPGYERYFVPQNMEIRYAAVDEDHVRIMEIGEKDPEEVGRRLFPDAEIVGSSEFVGSFADTGDLDEFAAARGANIVLWHTRWLDSTTEVGYHRYLEPERRVIVGRTRRGKVVTDSTTVYRHDYVPYSYTEHIFRHHVLFLRTGDRLGGKEVYTHSSDEQDE